MRSAHREWCVPCLQAHSDTGHLVVDDIAIERSAAVGAANDRWAGAHRFELIERRSRGRRWARREAEDHIPPELCESWDSSRRTGRCSAEGRMHPARAASTESSTLLEQNIVEVKLDGYQNGNNISYRWKPVPLQRVIPRNSFRPDGSMLRRKRKKIATPTGIE